MTPAPQQIQLDRTNIALCLDLAAKGGRATFPNPMVGAVLACRDKILSGGYHQYCGGPHAEVEALRAFGGEELPPGTTIYVNLEPCCHHGRTPPCTDLIIKSGIRRVVIAMLDANPQVAGKGVAQLQEAGIEVVIAGDAFAARWLNRRFLSHHQRQRPYVILKWAQTADGFIARSDGTSKWITGVKARALVHQWRGEEAAILAGTNTIAIDNPLLTARPGDGNGQTIQPLRIVLDRTGRISPSALVFNDDAPTLVLTEQGRYPVEGQNVESATLTALSDLESILTELASRQILSLFVEGGAKIINSFLARGLWDECRVFTSPLCFKEGTAAPVRTNGATTEQSLSREDSATPDKLITVVNPSTIKWLKG